MFLKNRILIVRKAFAPTGQVIDCNRNKNHYKIYTYKNNEKLAKHMVDIWVWGFAPVYLKWEEGPDDDLTRAKQQQQQQNATLI